MSKEVLAFSRNNEASVRLYLQHWMCQYETGFILHPAIPTDKKDLKILDVACGTGIWLVDLSRSLPEAQLDGFDISDSHFPSKSELPENVKLFTHDALKPPTEDISGKYDVVHVGRINLFIRNEDPAPLLQNFMKMLKPGGYLHWDELDVGGMHTSIEKPYATEMNRFGKSWLESQGCTSQWVSGMTELFESHNLKVHDYRRVPIRNHMAKPWTEMQIMANRDFVEHDVIPSTQGNPNLPSADRWREMLRGVEKEAQGGLRILMDIVYIVGQKAE
ncbi:uncharacterized protein EAF02_004639 [Botrytis sinoallii]|uniref:uncharacterized protein n=1 Tax=Botrytis sinoallii TaxID=1463999 RepID=UPI0018FF8435|nr:uncharacterized protein EAF02_004639 [Botrytis sinoallii]KAF7884303.1 hypothetical protein EAF02_004639 [Botrytis sinoallii]